VISVTCFPQPTLTEIANSVPIPLTSCLRNDAQVQFRLRIRTYQGAPTGLAGSNTHFTTDNGDCRGVISPIMPAYCQYLRTSAKIRHNYARIRTSSTSVRPAATGYFHRLRTGGTTIAMQKLVPNRYRTSRPNKRPYYTPSRHMLRRAYWARNAIIGDLWLREQRS
jgi:hypothetical protein